MLTRLHRVLLLTVAFACFTHAQTIDALKARAQAGDADAMFTISKRYWMGDGVKQDYSQALHWLQLSADKGNDKAMNDMGLIYESGFVGVARSYDKAMHWRRLAAEKGNHDAMFAIGNMYLEGLGVRKDPKIAMRWFQKAADSENEDAGAFLAYGYEHGYGVERNLPIAVYWYTKYVNSPNGARDSNAKAALAALRKRGIQPSAPSKRGTRHDSKNTDTKK